MCFPVSVGIKLPRAIFPEQSFFCGMERKRLKEVEQRLANFERKNLKRISGNTLVGRMMKS